MPRIASRLGILASLAWLLALASCASEDRQDQATARPIEPIPGFTRAVAIERYFKDRVLGPIEGIWLESNGAFEIAIAPNDTGWRQDWPFAGFVINASDSAWRRGTPRLYFKAPAINGSIDAWIAGDAATFLPQGPNALDATIPNPFGTPKRLRLLRAYPEIAQAPPSLRPPADGQPGGGHGPGRRAFGTGFFVAKNLVATNNHVIEGGKSINVEIGLEKFEAELIRRDPRLDLALVRIKPMVEPTYSCLTLSPNDDLAEGEKVYLLGHPIPTTLSSDLKIGEGIVNAPRGVRGDSTRFQHSIPSQPGNSGGPTINANGFVVGVLVSGLDRIPGSRATPQNVNFSIKVRFLREMLAGLPREPCTRTVGPSGRELGARDIFERYGAGVSRMEVSQ